MTRSTQFTAPTGVASSRNSDSHYDVIVVGAGFAGLFMLYRLRGLGLTAKVFEAGSGVGGTWFWNRYPGARCDVESTEYSYSFSEELQQEWEWTERFAGQAEILTYINHVADRFDLRRDIQCNTRVLAATFDDGTNEWSVETDQGDWATARFCIMATGNLSLPNVPTFKGLESFKGNWYHTGLWPQDGVDFTGLRVGVIGTGSSGIQCIPMIAKQASHLHVFQRTPNFSLPAHNRPLTADWVKWVKANYPELREKARRAKSANALYSVPEKSVFEVSDEERQQTFERCWSIGGLNYLRAYNDITVNAAANETACEFVREKIRGIVNDLQVAEALLPNDHYLGTKRPCTDTGYYETFNRDDVTLVDVRQSPIERVTPTGVRTQDGDYELDAIVFATGYDAITGALRNIDISAKGGASLADKWEQGPRAYLGLMSAGFPNLFFITGPGSPSVLTNVIVAIEQHVNWLTDCLAHMQQTGVNRMEADKGFEDRWVDHVDELAHKTLMPTVNSWYTGANIPGKPRRVFTIYTGGFGNYREKCFEVAANGYVGFLMNNVPSAEVMDVDEFRRSDSLGKLRITPSFVCLM